MAQRNGHTAILGPNGRPYRFDYDAVEDKKRRRPPRVRLLSEDKHLAEGDRKKLVATARDVVRNWTIAAWMVRKHLDYVATFGFQARTADEAFNGRLEDLVRSWSRKANFDVAGRHSLGRYLRLAEARRTLDGDFGTLKLSSGRVQAIEGDRIRTPRSGLPKGVDPDDVVHGVILTKAGAARGYCLHKRGKLGDGFEFERIVPARHFLMTGYYDRFDQVRGISPLASAINTLQDAYEGLSYAACKAKVAQMFGLVTKFGSEEEESMGEVTTETDDAGNMLKNRTVVDFTRAPVQLDLDPEDSVELLESNHPPTQLLEFIKLLIMLTLKAVDIPYSWFDQKSATWSAGRTDWVLYDASAESRRADNAEFLNALLAWRIVLWLLDAELQLPKSMALEEVRWEWIPRKMAWVDPAKEAVGWEKALQNKLTSRSRICKSQGNDFYEIADELAAEEAYLAGQQPPNGKTRPPAKQTQYVASLKDYLGIAI